MALWLLAATAMAEASVVVQVRARTPVDKVSGQVTMKPKKGGGITHSCVVKRGTCRIVGVVGGRYTVTFRPAGKPPWPPHVAMIPPSGTTRLIVSEPRKP